MQILLHTGASEAELANKMGARCIDVTDGKFVGWPPV